MRVKQKVNEIVEGDTTPMIDIVFQLIAFFMVLVNFTEADQDNRVKLPRSELAQPPEESPENLLTVNLGREDPDLPWQIYIAGQAYTVDNVLQTLQRQADIITRKGDDLTQAVIVLRAHQEAPTGLVQEVIEKCQEANFEQFSLRAEEEVRY